jgi:hypothetical protein
MKTGGGKKSVAAAALVVVLTCSVAFFLLTGEKSRDTQKAPGRETAGGSSLYTVAVTVEAQRTGGITTEAMKPGRYQRRVTAYGKVLPPEGLNAARMSYIAAVAGLEKAEAALHATEKEYGRMKLLNASDKNVSDRALQASAAQLAADRAEAAHARGILQSAKDAISLEWGRVVSGWIFDCSAALRRLLETKDALIQVTVLPAFPVRGIPEKVMIEAPSGGHVTARFVSRATATDPKIQGVSFIYVASSRHGSIVPGMDVMVQMPSGGHETGYFVPLSAVVWLQDRAWVYIKKSETGFTRVELPTSNPVNEGYFVPGVFSPGDRLVVTGAQALLSEESAPKTTGGGGEEGDED